MYTMSNWIILGIMVITQFSHIMAFFWMKRQFSQSKSKQKHYLLNQHVAVAWPITQQCCFCCSFSTKKFLLLANFAKKDFLGTSLFPVTIIPVLHYEFNTTPKANIKAKANQASVNVSVHTYLTLSSLAWVSENNSPFCISMPPLNHFWNFR